MRAERHQGKKKKRKFGKIIRNLFIIFLLVVVAVVGYSYYQFKQGLQTSKADNDSSVPEQVYEFNGEKDQYGGTNILLLGSDSRGEENARADTIMVAHYQPDSGTYKMISFMRDMYVDIPGHGQNRINAALAYGGPELLRQTIKENFNIDSQYYAILDFEGFEKVIDVAFPNGVEINVEKEMSQKIGVTLKPGLQKLDGEHLLGYVRFRNDAVGDFGRVERQQNAIKAVMNQFTSLNTIAKLPKLVGVVTPYVNTNMKTSDILYMGKDVLMNGSPQVESLRIPADGTYQNVRISGMAVLQVDLEANKQELQQFLTN
ncbi:MULTISPECIES: LCP family protein [Cytobacillus]|uniref:LCP family protein n=1 Tax=Cytobacillus TaxID=2675230 RepID=UPI001CD6D0DA|nr:LCP family protein [Cytobacillus kochii]MCA1027414.1 LCP family protein [Cytobacillus kochii]MCM3322075.1 LCP family protein [Cytobacillus kochii]MCM3343093.1 LCP family protein [Cytobacillus kochii]MDM5206923.1 LCP family protein [Cytobacillus kochii]